jgi:hypothetical protein
MLSQMTSVGGHRIWRLRRLHQSIDATLVEDHDGVELRFLLNGELLYSRRWPTRGPAMEEATTRRSELEREGWMPHW